MSAKLPSQILREAADLLDKDGWCRGGLQDSNGRRCAVGAIADVACCSSSGNRHARFRAEEALADTLESYYELDGPRIIYWNDYVVRDKRYVIRRFRSVAKQLEAAGE